MLHIERLKVTCLLPVGVLPTPPCRFIEDDVAGDDDTLIDRVLIVIHLGHDLIPNEDSSPTSIVKLL
jgi:hypothetical protein